MYDASHIQQVFLSEVNASERNQFVPDLIGDVFNSRVSGGANHTAHDRLLEKACCVLLRDPFKRCVIVHALSRGSQGLIIVIVVQKFDRLRRTQIVPNVFAFVCLHDPLVVSYVKL